MEKSIEFLSLTAWICERLCKTGAFVCLFWLKTSQEHSVKPNVMDVHAYVVLLNIIAFLLNFVTLQSPQPNENHYPFLPLPWIVYIFFKKINYYPLQSDT